LARITISPRSVAPHSAYPQYFPNPPDSAPFQQSPYKNTGMFNQARDFTVAGTFVEGNGEIPSTRLLGLS
jgi:hypothetical protein